VFLRQPLSATLLALAAIALVGPRLYGLYRARRGGPEHVPSDA
jgi:hypothetical protein